MTDQPWRPSERYPDPAIEALDPAFKAYHLVLSAVERLWHGSRWGEGPVWLGDARCVLWSDIPNNRVLKWEEETGAVSLWQKPSNNANGHTRDRQGRILACEHAGRRVVRFEYDGSITVIADSFQGKRLNSPNDVVVKSDGSIWFTDPPFGLYAYYEGIKNEPELPATNVYRVDGQTGEITLVTNEVNHPNGLAFSPDEKILYIVESRADPRNILAFDVGADGRSLGRRRDFIRCEPGQSPDGFRV
ncbi:MAG: SMP-30/gluconolactonase/LRE family protein, partial [Acetobacteraceae bacterium]|nr:SMP-30/gluconolactonase/LRE family protein [Acetobacteraceae bacterium]